MNSKMNTMIVVLFPVFFIAFKSSLMFVDASLPNADLRIATTCLRTFFGESEKNHKFFLENNNSLTDGEFLATFCDEISPEDIDNKISEKANGNYDGEEIKQCLREKNREDIFDEYCKTEPPKKNNIILMSPYGNSKSPLVGFQQITQMVPTENEELSNDDTPILKFINGMCRSEEFIEFDDLIDEKDKGDALECLEECLGKFMGRIEVIVDNAKSKTIEMVENKLSIKENDTSLPPNLFDAELAKLLEDDNALKKKYNEQISNLKNTVKINKHAATFTDDVSKKKKKKDIDLKAVLETGYLYLQNYGNVYINVDQCLTADDRRLNNWAKNLDKNLFVSFSLYEECAKRGCSMKPPKSIPLYQFIEYASKDPDYQNANFTTLFINRVKEYGQKLGLLTPSYRKFFKALWNEEKDIEDTDPDSQSTSTK